MVRVGSTRTHRIVAATTGRGKGSASTEVAHRYRTADLRDWAAVLRAGTTAPLQRDPYAPSTRFRRARLFRPDSGSHAFDPHLLEMPALSFRRDANVHLEGPVGARVPVSPGDKVGGSCFRNLVRLESAGRMLLKEVA